MPARPRLLQAHDLCFAGTVLQVKNPARLRAQLPAFDDYTEDYVTLGRPWVGESGWQGTVMLYPVLGSNGERRSLGLSRLRQYFYLPDPPQPPRKVYTAKFRSRRKGLYHLDLKLSLNRPDEAQLALPAELPLEQVLPCFQQRWPEWFRTLDFLGIEDAGDEIGAGCVTYLAAYFQG